MVVKSAGSVCVNHSFDVSAESILPKHPLKGAILGWAMLGGKLELAEWKEPGGKGVADLPRNPLSFDSLNDRRTMPAAQVSEARAVKDPVLESASGSPTAAVISDSLLLLRKAEEALVVLRKTGPPASGLRPLPA